MSAVIERRRTASAMLGLTGVLVYNAEDLVELVEGAAPSIVKVLALVANEPALVASSVVFDRQVPSRWYRTWRAGYVPRAGFDEWLAAIVAPGESAAKIDAVKRFLDEARTF